MEEREKKKELVALFGRQVLKSLIKLPMPSREVVPSSGKLVFLEARRPDLDVRRRLREFLAERDIYGDALIDELMQISVPANYQVIKRLIYDVVHRYATVCVCFHEGLYSIKLPFFEKREGDCVVEGGIIGFVDLKLHEDENLPVGENDAELCITTPDFEMYPERIKGMGVTKGGKLYAIIIQGQIFAVNPKIIFYLRKNCRKFSQERVSIGCDPEFEQISDGKVVPANVEGGLKSSIGKDGAGSQVEIRPAWDYSVEKLVENIRELIQLCPSIGVKGDVYPLGGHIHFGPQRSETIVQKMTGVLDDFIGRITLPTSGEARGDYKKLSAYRTNSWGWEYRTPPSNWCHNPRIATAVLKLAHGLVSEMYSRKYIEYKIDRWTGYASDEDFLRFLSAEEYRYYRDFYDSYGKNGWGEFPINRNWSSDVSLQIVFKSDDVFSSVFKGIAWEVFSSLKLDGLVLFGFKSERGMVYWIDGVSGDFLIPGTEIEVKYQEGYWSHVGHIGLPYSIRVSQDKKLIRSFLEGLVQKMKEGGIICA